MAPSRPRVHVQSGGDALELFDVLVSRVSAPGQIFAVVYPGLVDPVDLAFNTSQFAEFHQTQNEVVPNAIYIFANYTDGSYGG